MGLADNVNGLLSLLAAAINDTMQKMAETDNYSIGNILFGLAIALVFQAIFGLILAAIFKSKSNQGL